MNSLQQQGSTRVAYLALVVAIGALLLGIIRPQITGVSTTTESSQVQQSSFSKDSLLKVAIVPAPPITAIDPSSKKPVGYAVDVIDAIGRNAKLKIEYLPSDWATMGAALSSGKADVVIGPIFVTEGRAREAAFTDSLFAYAVVAVVPKGSNKVHKLDDLKTAGLRIAVGRGGFDSEFVSRNMPEAKVSVFPPDDPNLSMLEVIAGRADIALADYATAKRFVAEHPEVELRFEDTPVSVQYAAFMLRQGDTVLRDLLNIALRNLDLSGELSTIDSKYANQKSWYGRVSYHPTLIR